MFRLRGSSSTSPIGAYPSRGFLSISRMTSWPASPAPTISASLPRVMKRPRVGRSISVLARSRAPVTNATASSQSMAMIPRGTLRVTGRHR